MPAEDSNLQLLVEGERLPTDRVEIMLTSRVVDRQHPNANQITKSVHNGKIIEGARSLYLIFSDKIEEAGDVDYTIRISENDALIRRKGALPFRQPLVVGMTLPGTYEAPYGTLRTEATALKIEAAWDRQAGSGRARFVYEMALQGQYIGRFTIDYVYARRLRQ